MYTHYQNEPISTAASNWFRRWLSIAIAIVFMLVSLAAVAAWYIQSTRILSVQTASMAPLIKPGDAVIVQKVAASELQLGDVVSFYGSPSNGLGQAAGGSSNRPVIMTHRVVKLDLPNGVIWTQGDGNAVVDPAFDPSLLVGRVTRLLPNIGHAVDLVHSRAGLVLGVYVPAIIIVLAELRRLTIYYSPAYRHPSRA